MPYATLEEPPVDLRARILDAAVARAQPVAKDAPRPAARAARRVVWSRFIAAAAAMVALAFGFDSWRTRQELALQREVTVALQEPNVVRSFALAGTGAASGAVGRVTLDLDAKKGAVVLKGMPACLPARSTACGRRSATRGVPCGQFTAGPDGAVLAQFVVPVESAAPRPSASSSSPSSPPPARCTDGSAGDGERVASGEG
jgi:hypothetical protein